MGQEMIQMKRVAGRCCLVIAGFVDADNAKDARKLWHETRARQGGLNQLFYRMSKTIDHRTHALDTCVRVSLRVPRVMANAVAAVRLQSCELTVHGNPNCAIQMLNLK